MRTTILLVDDQPFVRVGVRTVLEQDASFCVVGEAGDGVTAVRLAAALTPSVVVMDIGMPDLNGTDATRRICAANPAVRVVVLSVHEDVTFVDAILQAGARAYVVKHCAPEELVTAVRAVIAGQTYLSPRVAGGLVDDWMRRRSGAVAPEPTMATTTLSAREREVLQLVAEGWSTKQIAQRLDIAAKTVESHRHRIMARLGLFSIADLTKYAVRHGLTSI